MARNPVAPFSGGEQWTSHSLTGLPSVPNSSSQNKSSTKYIMAVKILLYSKQIELKSQIVYMESASMIYTSISILRCSILQRVGDRKGDYGLDHVHTSEMCLHHFDLVSYAKAEKKTKKQCLSFPMPECFWASFRCGFELKT